MAYDAPYYTPHRFTCGSVFHRPPGGIKKGADGSGCKKNHKPEGSSVLLSCDLFETPAIGASSRSADHQKDKQLGNLDIYERACTSISPQQESEDETAEDDAEATPRINGSEQEFVTMR